MMKRILVVFCLFCLLANSLCSEPICVIDLNIDNPSTLIGTNSINYKICGFRLGLSHDQAWEIIKRNNLILGEIDEANPSRIYVYCPNLDGIKGDSVLYLIWEPNEIELSQIIVFHDYRNFLTQNFRRLLSFESLDDKSDFKKSFIGYANRTEVTLDLPSLDLKITSYVYDDIGLEVIHNHFADEEKVAFAIVKTNH